MDEVYKLIDLMLATEEEAQEDLKLKAIQQRRKEMNAHYPDSHRQGYLGQ